MGELTVDSKKNLWYDLHQIVKVCAIHTLVYSIHGGRPFCKTRIDGFPRLTQAAVWIQLLRRKG